MHVSNYSNFTLFPAFKNTVLLSCIFTRTQTSWSVLLVSQQFTHSPSHAISTVIAPRAIRPCTEPRFHFGDTAGRITSSSPWLCSSISAIPAVNPRFPSIWNGGCAQNRFGYTPPPCTDISAKGSRTCSICATCFAACAPSSILAHIRIFHARLQPVPSSPRTSRLFCTPSRSSGVFLVIPLPGWNSYRCDKCLCSTSASGSSSFHSRILPSLPSCVGTIADSCSRIVFKRALSFFNTSHASR